MRPSGTTRIPPVGLTLDAMVEAFRNRPLDAGPYTYLCVDALVQRVRENGRAERGGGRGHRDERRGTP